jgi:hypothetical protein
LPVNGKAYVKKAFKLLGDWRVFRQNIVKYKPLLDHHIEVFLFIDNRDLFPLLDCVGRFCLMAEFYSGMEDKAVVRLIGDVNLLYGLMDFNVPGGMQLFIFDKKKTWSSPGVRFTYEDLFNSKTGEWTFDKDRILKNMEVQKDG